MVEIINLSCPSCGGRLQISPQIDRFACGYCGNELMVKRGGGIVSLEPIVEVLKDVKKGVNKSSSELAIVRLEKEIAELNNALRKSNAAYQNAPNTDDYVKSNTILTIVIGIGGFILIEDWSGKIIFLIIIGILYLIMITIGKALNGSLFGYRIKRYNEWKAYHTSLQDKLATKQNELALHRRIVNE